jgi:hypothetical protein
MIWTGFINWLRPPARITPVLRFECESCQHVVATLAKGDCPACGGALIRRSRP